MFAGLGIGCASSTPATEEAVTEVAATPTTSPQEGPLQDRADMSWWRDSMKTRADRIAWFKEARFGLFIHWGPYSQAGGVWDGKTIDGSSEHLMRRAKIPMAVYQEKLVAKFNPTQFNADEWCGAAKKAGMGYVVVTAKHHDGFAMYDSEASPYNVVKATPWKRDPLKDIKAACQKAGLKFGVYYSQALDWEHADAPGNDWERGNPGGDKRLYGGGRWWEGNPQLLERVTAYVDGKAVPQVKELISKYDPDLIWFDVPNRLPPDLNLRILKAVREAKPSIVVNGRIVQPVPGGPENGFGDYVSTTDQPAEFSPHVGEFEGVPTTNASYGFHSEDKSHKSPAHFIELLAKAAARGGNILLNVGPTPAGKFDAKDQAILDGIGAWMKVNGDSILKTERTPLPVQAWGESTLKGNTLYLHVFQWPTRGRVVVGGLKTAVKKAYLLSEPGTSLAVQKLGDKDVVVKAPDKAPDAADTVIALELAGAPEVDPVRLIGQDVPADMLRAFDGKLVGDLRYGPGKERDAYVTGWTQPKQSVRWQVRLREKVNYEVAIAYAAEKESLNNSFVVNVGSKVLEGKVAEDAKAPVVLGQVTLPPGETEISVEAVGERSGELMRLRGIVLRPKKGK
ncbi:MAG TPA: alpha-L-fucosidase [Polyangia bacterium]